MHVEGFDFERSSTGAFTRGDRELSAQAMRLIVDSLKAGQERIENEFRNTIDRDMRFKLSGGLDSSAIPVATRPDFSATSALIRARMISTTVATYFSGCRTCERETDQYLVEIYKKYSIPAACIVFVLVGVPLGIMARRGGFGIAATLSLGFFVLYWACLIGGEKLADRESGLPLRGHVDRQHPHRHYGRLSDIPCRAGIVDHRLVIHAQTRPPALADPAAG